MSKKFYIIIIAVLVVLNIFSWRIWWDGPKHMVKKRYVEGERGDKRGSGGKNFLSKKLGLNEQQKQLFEEHRKDYFKEIGEVKDSMNIVRKKILWSFKEGSDSIQQKVLIEEMANYKVRLELLTMEHFNGLRSICNEDQIAVFDSLLSRMIEYSPMFKEGSRGRGKHRQETDEKKYRHK